MTAPGDDHRRPLRTVPRVRTTSLALFLACFALYLSNGRTRAPEVAGDTGSNRLVPFSLLRFGTLTLEPFRAAFAAAGPLRWYVQERRGRLVASYPLGTPIVALPVYGPIVAGLALAGRASAEELFQAASWSEKLAASAIAAGVVVATFLVLARRVSRRRALFIAITLGCCTLLWPVAGQMLWQHGPGALLIALGFLSLDRRQTPASALSAGLLFGLLFAVRPMTLPFAAAAALGVIVGTEEGRAGRIRHLAAFGSGFALLVVSVLAYNLYFFKHPLGVYASGKFAFQWLEGPLGLLFSPNRGMLVFMPVTLFGLMGAAIAVRRWRSESQLAAMVFAGLAYFLIHAWSGYWAGGWSFGPRYVIELLPLLAIAGSLVELRSRVWPLLALAWLASFAVQANGAYIYPNSNWHGRMGKDLERAAWDWQHVMLWEDLQAWRAGQPRPSLP